MIPNGWQELVYYQKNIRSSSEYFLLRKLAHCALKLWIVYLYANTKYPFSFDTLQEY